jgi:hypothetical protein
MKGFLGLVLFLFLYSIGNATTIIAAAGGGNWSSTASWVGAATPTAADDVAVTASSGPITVDVGTAVCKSVTATGYVSNLTFSAGQTLTVSGNVIWGSGMTLIGTGVLSVIVNSTMTSQGLVFPGTFIGPQAAQQTYTLGDAWTISGSVSFGNANNIVNGNSITVGGNLSSNGALTGTTTFVMNGSGNWTGNFTGTGTSKVNLNTSGSITIQNITATSGPASYIAGTINSSGATLNLTGTYTCNFPGIHWQRVNNATTTSSGLTIQSNFICDGAVSYTGITLAAAKNIIGPFQFSCTDYNIPAGVTSSLGVGTTLAVSNSFTLVSDRLNPSSLKCVTGSSTAYLNYTGTLANCQISNANITDIDASGSSNQILNYFGGTLTRTTNIRNVTLPVPAGFIY